MWQKIVDPRAIIIPTLCESVHYQFKTCFATMRETTHASSPPNRQGEEGLNVL